MSLKNTSYLVAMSLFISACSLMAGSAIAQDVQVRSEVVVSGSTAADDSVDAVIVPDLLDEIPGVAYTDWVPPEGDRDFQTIDFLPKGGLLVRNGLVYSEFLTNGTQKISDAFPINCTKLRFDSPKGQSLQDTFLSDCSASLVRNDNTMRICGSVKGQGLKCIAYDLNNPGGDCAVTPLPMTIAEAEARTCEAVRTTAEPPPQLTDAFSDDSDFVELRWLDGEPRILIAGDRKSIFAIRPASSPIVTLDSEDTVETIATFGGGLKVNAFTTLKESLIVAFESGELRKFNLMTGVDGPFYQHPLPLCGDRKTPQGFALRSSPDEEFVLALNRACGTVTVLDSLGDVVDTDGDTLENPFVLSNSSPNPPGDFLGEGVVARAGESGTFLDCIVGLTCQLGQVEGQVTQSNTTVVQQDTFDPAYRIFQSIIKDCRWTLTRPCPIVNCLQADTYTATAPDGREASCPPQEEQILNLTELTLRADSSGALAALLPDPPPVVTIPAYLRGDYDFPGAGVFAGDRVLNDYEFYSLWAVSEVLITDVFDLIIDVDLHRFDLDGNIISDDPSDVVLPAGATESERLLEVEDRSNAVIHNRDTYNTVPRFPDDVAPDRKSGVLIDADTGSKSAGGYQWSAITYGLQTYYDSAAGYLGLAKQQLWELQAHKDEFLCSPFVDPDGSLVGPVLSDIPCDLLQSELGQLKAKTLVCHAALLKPQQGSSRENCSALSTKINNALETVNDPVLIPPPIDVALITPNYLGEWESRLQAYRFTTEEWLLPVTPTGGIPAPAADILQPADGSSFLTTGTIIFEAVAEDQSPVVIDVTDSIEWTSNRDGILPTTGGGPFSFTLSEGVHIITARAFDAGDNPGSASVVVSVAPAP